jgi:hypothetical protein
MCTAQNATAATDDATPWPRSLPLWLRDGTTSLRVPFGSLREPEGVSIIGWKSTGAVDNYFTSENTGLARAIVRSRPDTSTEVSAPGRLAVSVLIMRTHGLAYAHDEASSSVEGGHHRKQD